MAHLVTRACIVLAFPLSMPAAAQTLDNSCVWRETSGAWDGVSMHNAHYTYSITGDTLIGAFSYKKVRQFGLDSVQIMVFPEPQPPVAEVIDLPTATSEA